VAMLKLKNKDLLTLTELSSAEFNAIMRATDSLKKRGSSYRPLIGKTVGLLFRKTSTRTRISFQAGVNQLGGQTLDMQSAHMQFKEGETIADTARVLSRYLDALVVRTYDQSEVVEFGANASIPVINGLTDYCHPCQILADLFSLREKGLKLKGLPVAYFGDGNNVANSLVFGAALSGVSLTLCSPPGCRVSDRVIAAARKISPGLSIRRESEPKKAAKGQRVLYTDTWISMGQKKVKAKLKAMRPYQLNAKLLALASKQALVMHCLPAHRGQEITDEVMDGPNSIVFEQAENRMHVQKALLTMLMA
jgi:ornithine carbamoyltransferase